MGPNVQRKIVQKNGIKPTNITEIKSRYGPKKKSNGTRKIGRGNLEKKIVYDEENRATIM